MDLILAKVIICIFCIGSELVFPACVVNGTGVSKTFQILYRNEEVALDDAIMFRAHILVDSHKVNMFVWFHTTVLLFN